MMVQRVALATQRWPRGGLWTPVFSFRWTVESLQPRLALLMVNKVAKIAVLEREYPFPAARIGEWQRGWRTLLAAAIGCAFGFPIFASTAALFIVPMQTDLGWSRSALAFGPLVGIGAALVAPFCGAIVDRIGFRRCALFGLSTLSILFFALATLPARPPVFYGIMILIALNASFAGPMVFTKCVTGWFREHMGAAVGLTSTFLAFLFAVITPILNSVIQHYGWRAGYGTIGLLIALIALPIVALYLREGPDLRSHDFNSEKENQSNVPGLTLGEALGNSRFWLLLAFFLVSTIAIGGFTNHLVPLLISRDFSSQSAAVMASLYFLANGLGRGIFGFILDKVNPPLVAVTAMLFACIGSFLLVLTSVSADVVMVALAVFMLGLANGAEVDFVAFFIMRLFGLRSYSTLFGILGGFANGVGLACGGFLYARIFDQSGSYYWAIIISLFAFFSAAVLMGLLGLVAKPRSVNRPFSTESS